MGGSGSPWHISPESAAVHKSHHSQNSHDPAPGSGGQRAGGENVNVYVNVNVNEYGDRGISTPPIFALREVEPNGSRAPLAVHVQVSL